MVRAASHDTLRHRSDRGNLAIPAPFPRAGAGLQNEGEAYSIGAWVVAGGTRFKVWAPAASLVELVVEGEAAPWRVNMARVGDGYHAVLVPGLTAGARYRLSPDGRGPFPDPASKA